jgi:hypothetical protein
MLGRSGGSGAQSGLFAVIAVWLVLLRRPRAHNHAAGLNNSGKEHNAAAGAGELAGLVLVVSWCLPHLWQIMVLFTAAAPRNTRYV